jgi:predicted PurR-regulated permease PerM
VRKLPGYIDLIQQDMLPQLAANLGVERETLALGALKEAILKNWQSAGGLLVSVIGDISKSGLVLLAWLGNLVLIPVVTFYLLRDWDLLIARLRNLLPRRVEPIVVSLATECDRVLAEFLRGQLLVMAALGLIYSIGLWIVGLDVALLVGMVSGLASFVPYLGLVLGILLAGIAAYFQFQEFLPLLYVAAVFGVGQLVEGMLLTPILVGDRIGLHPVAVIFAVLAGGQLFGFLGILLALPAAAVVVVLLRHAHRHYLESGLYQP